MNNYYVYVYLDPRKPGYYKYCEYVFNYEPFYVGKGTRYRLKKHLNESRESNSNNFKFNKINKIRKDIGIDPIVIKYKENLNENEAFELEIDMIDTIGRTDLMLGPLTNVSDGGRGSSGYKYTEEQRNKCRDRVTGKNNPMYGVHRYGIENPFYGKKHKNDYGVLEKNAGWIDIDKNDFLKLYNSGKTIEEMSKILNVNHGTISKRINLWKLKRKQPFTKPEFVNRNDNPKYGEENARWVDIDKNICLELYNNNISIENISKHFNVSIPLIRRRLKDWDVKKRKDITIGKKYTDISKQKISESKMGLCGELNANHKYFYEFVSPDGLKYEFTDINNFCQEHNLNYGTIRKSFKRGNFEYKKWKISRKLKQ